MQVTENGNKSSQERAWRAGNGMATSAWEKVVRQFMSKRTSDETAMWTFDDHGGRGVEKEKQIREVEWDRWESKQGTLESMRVEKYMYRKTKFSSQTDTPSAPTSTSIFTMICVRRTSTQCPIPSQIFGDVRRGWLVVVCFILWGVAKFCELYTRR